MKSLLTVAAGMLICTASGVSACPLMEGKHQTTELGQDQTQQSLVEHDVDTTDSELLAKLLLLEKEKAVN